MKTLLPAAILLLGLSSPVFAAPGTPEHSRSFTPASNSSIILAKNDHHRDHGRHHGWDRDRHHGWHHHRGWHRQGPPHGWRRYHRRPWDWRTRGCILFGPVWFCP